MHEHAHAHGSPLGFTGERVLPDEPEWAWCFQAHKFGYDDLAGRITPGARVLDVGCGEGYGADLLARIARSVIASDYSLDAVKHARDRYTAPNIAWVVCDGERLPFRDASFDVVSSLQVIEHLHDIHRHLDDVARVLQRDGWHYVATPNIDQMSEAERDNPYHVSDLDTPMLRDALARIFADVEIVGMFYREDSQRVRAMRAAEAREDTDRTKIDRVERVVARLPGPLRVKLRPLLRRIAGVSRVTADEARNAILAEDFEARGPAEESFCLIGIARAPRR